MTGRGGLALVDVSPPAAAHLSIALRRYREQLRRDGMAPPVELRALERFFAERASSSAVGVHSGSALDGFAVFVNSQDVIPRTHSYEQAAGLLGCSRSTVKRLIAAGRLPTVEVGRRRRVHTADLEQYLDEQRSAIRC